MSCGLLGLTFTISQVASGQSTTGSIYGQVTDPSNALVVGAEVIALNQATGVRYKGQSDSAGNYTVFNLPPGTYSVAVTTAGFETAKIDNVQIVIDQKQLLNFQMKVGASTEVVTVTGAPTMLQTESSETGEVIQSHDIVNLPLLGRTFYSLTGLTAGVTGGSGNTNSFNFSVNGQREYANSIQIDGVESTTNRTQDITATPSVDAVEEFKVSTSGYSAEFGRSAGGEVSIQTKSGANQWHGDAYEFFRPNFTAAKNYGFDGVHIPPQILKQHNYGGTFGGPIKKDKTFFFISYEGTKQASSNNYVDSVPPISQIKVLPDGSVDLSGLIDPLAGKPGVPAGQVIPIFDPAVSFSFCPATQSYGGCAQQFPGNIIPASEVSKAGLNTLLNFFPKPNLPGTDNGWFKNFLVDSPLTFDQKQVDARLDQNFSNNDKLAIVFHYNDSNTLDTGPYVGHTSVPEAGDNDFGNNQNSAAQEYSITETHLFSSRFINEARFGYTRYYLNQYPLLQGKNLASQFGVGNVNVPGFPATYGYPYIQLYSGYFTGGSTYKPFYIQDHNWQLSDSVILSGIGKHELKFGGDFRRLNSFPNFSLFPTGYQYYGAYFSPATSDPTFAQYFNINAWFPNGGSDIADLLVGLPFQTDIGLQLTNPHTQSWEMHFYGQDTYKVTPRLTLNFGLRYEYQAPFTEAGNNVSNYDPKTDSVLLGGRGSNSAGLVNSRWNDFAPRVGFAYQITPKTVLRAGWGIFYSPENDAREDILTKNYPFAELSQYQDYYYSGPPPYQLDAGIPRNTTINIPSGASSIPTINIPNGKLLTTYYVNPKIRTGYSELFNLAMQQELGSNFTLEAAFVGSKSHNLSYQIGDINFNLDPKVLAEGLLTPNLGKIQALTDGGWGEYDSLQVKLTKRVSANLNFLANYTYSHNLDNGPAPFNLGVNSDYPQNPYNLNAEIASADSDIRHNFVFSGLYRLPVGHGQAFFGNWGRVPELMFGGWQLNGILNVHSGTPINVVRGASLTTCPGVRPNLVGNPNVIPASLQQPGTDYWFNPQAFDITPFTGPTACSPGGLPRNFLTGPGFAGADASIFKEFDIKERAKLQTRFEVFNVTNTPHFANPDAVATDGGTFGQINRTYGNMRIIQLAAKIIF
jgi:outer membrane receptor protein involved in Fe transport